MNQLTLDIVFFFLVCFLLHQHLALDARLLDVLFEIIFNLYSCLDDVRTALKIRRVNFDNSLFFQYTRSVVHFVFEIDYFRKKKKHNFA